MAGVVNNSILGSAFSNPLARPQNHIDEPRFEPRHPAKSQITHSIARYRYLRWLFLEQRQSPVLM